MRDMPLLVLYALLTEIEASRRKSAGFVNIQNNSLLYTAASHDKVCFAVSPWRCILIYALAVLILKQQVVGALQWSKQKEIGNCPCIRGKYDWVDQRLEGQYRCVSLLCFAYVMNFSIKWTAHYERLKGPVPVGKKWGYRFLRTIGYRKESTLLVR